MRTLLLTLAVVWSSFLGSPIASAQPICPGDCGGDRQVTVDELLIGVNIALNEAPVASCASLDRNGDGEVTVEELLRGVAAALEGCPVSPTVIYDRRNHRLSSPIPDDFWLVGDTTKPNGVRLNVPVPAATADVQGIFKQLTREPNKLDGFSPSAHFVVELSDAPDPASVPLTSVESVAADANVALYDLTPGSPTQGQRVPFRVDLRSDHSVMNILSHSMLIYPSIQLEPGGRYGFVVTRRVRSLSGYNFEPSVFMQTVLAPPSQTEEAPEVAPVRSLVDDVVAGTGVARADIALALRFTIRTTDDIPADLVAIKDQVLAAPAPHFEILPGNIMPGDTSDVAAIIKGSWDAPDWRSGNFIARDADGKPRQTKTNKLDFWLALPKAAATTGHVPITMYQHGNPGDPKREVPSSARNYLGAAGYAVIGFRDILNRELSPNATNEVEAITAQVTAIFFPLIQSAKVPDFWEELNAEQLAFLQLIKSLGTVDVLPLGHPDGIPDMDPTLPLTYVGISQGANYAPAFLPYAPEIRAAGVIVGGGRLAETLIHQQPQAILMTLGMVYPNMTATDLWVGMSLFQHMFDKQDAANHARYMYREPVSIAGSTKKGSILQVEGLTDSLVPNNASEALAYAFLPLPHVAPVQRPVPALQVVDGPIVGNVDADTTAAFYQYVPIGVEGIAPTPGCLARHEPEGHYCAQSAAESLRQRIVFFDSAVRGEVPKIIDPLAP